MSISITGYAKSVTFSYDNKEAVKGNKAHISARNPHRAGEVFAEKKEIANDGSAALAFPQHYVGACEVVITGSAKSDGEAETLHIV